MYTNDTQIYDKCTHWKIEFSFLLPDGFISLPPGALLFC